MYYFDDWREHKDCNIRPSLLWEYDLEHFDWNKMRPIVVQRIIERGLEEDWYAGINLYGGIEAFREAIKEVPQLNAIDFNFVCKLFRIKKEEMRCYTRRQLRQRLFNS